jgi:hypothetical protein
VALLLLVAAAASEDPAVAEWFLGSEPPEAEPAAVADLVVDRADSEDVALLADRLAAINEPESGGRAVTYGFACSVLPPSDLVASLLDESVSEST